MSNRVVVTGIGAVSPVGNTAADFIDNILASKSGVAPITKFDAASTGITLACEVKDFDPGKRLSKRDYKRLDAYAQYGLYSAVEAMEQAGLHANENYQPEDLGVIYGTGIGGIQTIEEQTKKAYLKGPKRVPRSLFQNQFLTWLLEIFLCTLMLEIRHRQLLMPVLLEPMPLVMPLIILRPVVPKL